MEKLEKIVVATDFSEFSEKALGAAKMIAKAVGANLYLLHVFESWDLKEHYTGKEPLSTLLFEPVKSKFIAQSKNIMHSLEKDGFNVTFDVLEGKPGPAIAKEAEKIGADLVIVGTHGTKGIGPLIMGSVARDVVGRAPCAVMVVK